MVSDDDLEVELRFVRGHAAGSLAGVFGPDSATWRVNREAAIFLGAGRALLLQLAHPWVANAVAEHSQVFADPIGRFHRTFRVMFAMDFGTLDQALAAARRLHWRHAEGGWTLCRRLALPGQRGFRASLGPRHSHRDGAGRPRSPPSIAFDRGSGALLRRKPRVRGAVRDSASQSAIELAGLCRIQQCA